MSERRRRRRRSLLLAALILALLAAAAVVAVLVLRGADSGTGAAAQASPQATPVASSATVRLSGLGDLEVHRREKATIKYRIVAASGSEWTVSLVITDRDGERVKARRLAGAAPSRERLQAEVPIDLPAGRYRYAIQLTAAGEAGSPAASPSATAGAAALQPAASAGAELWVRPPLPPGYPGAKAVAKALDWAAGRDGPVGVAVVDTNGEAAGGLREHRTFQAASLAKAILLVACLREDPTPDAATEATLTKMIEESDNGAAYTVFGRVGAKGMTAVAEDAGMEDYEQGDGWLDTRLSAADQARFFWDLDGLVPAAGRGLARRLLSSVTEMQRWGIPAAAGPEGWTTFFKSGWLGMDNKLMVQAAWMEKGEKRWALAIMTDDNPTRSYGWDTQKGVAGLLLGQEPTAAYLATVLE